MKLIKAASAAVKGPYLLQTSQHYGALGHCGSFGHGLPGVPVTPTKTHVSTAVTPGAGATGQMKGVFHLVP